jgi:hypothetical protein
LSLSFVVVGVGFSNSILRGGRRTRRIHTRSSN